MRKNGLVRVLLYTFAFVCGVHGGSANASALSDAAASLQPGEWMVLSTNGFGGSLIGACDNVHSILEWANKGTWNPVAREFHFVGQGHTACAKHIVYREDTNSWSTAALPSTIGVFGHAYEHNTVNPNNGDFFFRGYNSDQIEKYVRQSNSWTGLPPIGTQTQVAGAIEYFPEKRGLLYVDGDYGVYFYSEDSGSWSLVANTALTIDSSKPTLSMASYHNFASYNPVDEVIYFGGGNASTNVYAFDSTGRVSPVANSPVSIGINNALTVPDPSTGTQLIFADNGGIYALDRGSNSWSQVGSHPVMSHARDWRIAAPVSTHGVIMFLTWDFENSKVLLYRYAPGSGSPTATIPNPPGGLSGTPNN